MASGKKVLAVDDEEFNLDILQHHLSEAGFDVVMARDGREALLALSAHDDIDVIVLDRMMPNMNGIDVLHKLQADERLARIPVIMQTAAASSKQIEEGINAGVYYYLTKPYDEQLLLSIVRAAVRDNLAKQDMLAQLQQQRRTLGLMEQSRFRFRTLEEANNLSYLVANCFPDPERIVYGLNELLVNAIEHGNLGITYQEKSSLVASIALQDEIERRLNMPCYKDKFAQLEFESRSDCYAVTISDQGAGFDWSDYLDFSPHRAMDPNGRGIAIAKHKSFDRLEYIGHGNQVIGIVRKTVQ